MSDRTKLRALIIDDSPQARKLLLLMLHDLAEDIDIASDVVPEVGTAVIAIAPGSISFCDVCVFVIYFSYASRF